MTPIIPSIMPAMNEYMPTLATVEKSTSFVGFILPNRKPNIPIPTRITEIIKIVVNHPHHPFLYFTLFIAHFVFLFNIVGLNNGAFGANDEFWVQTTCYLQVYQQQHKIITIIIVATPQIT